MAEYKIILNDSFVQDMLSNPNAVGDLMSEVLNQILSAQATEQIGAMPYERSGERRNYRNGVRERALTTRFGTLNLQVPQLRIGGALKTELFTRYQRSEQAFVAALMEMVINGVSTRKVSRITEELCGAEFSKSTVSELCKRLDPKIAEWRNRPLGHFPFVLVDGIVTKVRIDGRVRPQSMLVATGVNPEGYREILGFYVGDSESEHTWSEFFASLKARGLTGVDLVVSDQHKGLVKAIQTHFQGASWQRCQTHFMRNIVDATPKALATEVRDRVRAILQAPDAATARTLLETTLRDYAERAPKAMACLEAGIDDALAIMALPSYYRKRLRTTNSVERLNEEIRRRERVIRIFPNVASLERLIGALLMEMDEEELGSRKYFEMGGYESWKKGCIAA
jgi:transposase-like protein